MLHPNEVLFNADGCVKVKAVHAVELRSFYDVIVFSVADYEYNGRSLGRHLASMTGGGRGKARLLCRECNLLMWNAQAITTATASMRTGSRNSSSTSRTPTQTSLWLASQLRCDSAKTRLKTRPRSQNFLKPFQAILPTRIGSIGYKNICWRPPMIYTPSEQYPKCGSSACTPMATTIPRPSTSAICTLRSLFQSTSFVLTGICYFQVLNSPRWLKDRYLGAP